jgi:hypothetical protein
MAGETYFGFTWLELSPINATCAERLLRSANTRLH